MWVQRQGLLERKYIIYSNTSWGLSRLNTTDKILRLKVLMMGWPTVIIRPGIFMGPEGGGVDPRYFVVLRSLTLLGNEARPCSPLAYDLASKKP